MEALALFWLGSSRPAASNVDEGRMVQELLVPAAIGDSVFAHEDLKEMAPEKHGELTALIKKPQSEVQSVKFSQFSRRMGGD